MRLLRRVPCLSLTVLIVWAFAHSMLTVRTAFADSKQADSTSVPAEVNGKAGEPSSSESQANKDSGGSGGIERANKQRFLWLGFAAGSLVSVGLMVVLLSLLLLGPKGFVARWRVAHYCNRAHVYYRLGQYKQAIDCFDQAIKVTATNKPGEAYYFRAQLYEELGEHEKAVQDREQAKQLGYEPEPKAM